MIKKLKRTESYNLAEMASHSNEKNTRLEAIRELGDRKPSTLHWLEKIALESIYEDAGIAAIEALPPYLDLLLEVTNKTNDPRIKEIVEEAIRRCF